jgi:hypothetical protein
LLGNRWRASPRLKKQIRLTPRQFKFDVMGATVPVEHISFVAKQVVASRKKWWNEWGKPQQKLNYSIIKNRIKMIPSPSWSSKWYVVWISKVWNLEIHNQNFIVHTWSIVPLILSS